MPEPILTIRDLTVEFDTEDGVVHAVTGVSWDLHPGEVLGVVGESGSGKSVSVLSVLGLIPVPPGRIVSGEAIFLDRDLLKLPGRRLREIRGGQIAMIFQDPLTSLNPVLKIGEQISEATQAHDPEAGDDAARKRTIELLELVGVPLAKRRVDQYPHEFSGGMRQRAMIAMAIANDPSVLVADEPTTALDVTIQAQILDLMRGAIEEFDSALILITHDLGVVAGMCRTTNVMYAGHIVERAPTSDLFGRPRHPYTVGLLRSIPRLDDRDTGNLVPIQGQPPDLSREIPGCPFADRCFNVGDRCRTEMPPLEHAPGTPDGHDVACWYPAEGERLVPSGFAAKVPA